MWKFFITVGIILYIALMLWVVWILYSRITARRIMREGRNKKSFAFNYLSTRFSRSNTIKNVKLLVKSSAVRGGKLVADMGLVFVNRGGIIIVESVPGSGFIDINEGGSWNRIMNDKFYTFDDPCVKNMKRVKAMKMFLRSEGVENVPVHSVVLFTGKKVKFSRNLSGLITANELTAFMIDLNKDRFLSAKEIREVVKLIKQKKA